MTQSRPLASRSTTRAVSTSPTSAMAWSTRQLAQAKTSVGRSGISQAVMSKSWIVKSLKRPPLVGRKWAGGAAGSWLTI
jgi:hypothetical protein